MFLTLMTEFVKKAKENVKDGMNLETRKQQYLEFVMRSKPRFRSSDWVKTRIF